MLPQPPWDSAPVAENKDLLTITVTSEALELSGVGINQKIQYFNPQKMSWSNRTFPGSEQRDWVLEERRVQRAQKDLGRRD